MFVMCGPVVAITIVRVIILVTVPVVAEFNLACPDAGASDASVSTQNSFLSESSGVAMSTDTIQEKLQEADMTWYSESRKQQQIGGTSTEEVQLEYV